MIFLSGLSLLRHSAGHIMVLIDPAVIVIQFQALRSGLMKFFQPADFMRKKPIQRRSESTIDTILEASAQILDAEGEKGLNTNDIATRSGFSVGTLYQYFKNKDAIVQAMAEREVRLVNEKFDQLIKAEKNLTQEAAVRAVVRVLIEPFSKRSRARRAAMLFLAKRIDILLARKIVLEMSGRLFERMRYHVAFEGVPDKVRRAVLMSAVMGAIRGTLIDDPELITTQGFEDELVTLVLAYLAAPVRRGVAGEL